MKKRNHNYIHGMADTRPYRIWYNMMGRCNNPSHLKYPIYGARGITVCAEWTTFNGFWEDMAEGYSDELTVDRIDGNGNYCKENCRWATTKQQARNRNNNIKYKGECAYDASVRLGGKRGLISQRVATRGWSLEKAFTTPVMRESVHKPKDHSELDQDTVCNRIGGHLGERCCCHTKSCDLDLYPLDQEVNK